MADPKHPHDQLGHANRIAGHLPGLLLEAERIAHTFMRGTHGRRRTGQGETFWQFRHYQPGDSSRDIDWRQTAKRDDARDETFVRQLEWEASQTLYLYRDASESMDFRSGNHLHTKKDFAEILLLALGIVTLNGGEQVGLLGTELSPQAHYNAMQKIADYLPRQQALAENVRPIAARSEVVLIADFYQPLEQISAFCAGLASRGVAGTLLQVCDPAEEDLPYGGRVKFLDAENESETITIPQVESIRGAYLQKFAEHRAQIGNLAASIGWRFLHARTDEKPENVLTRLYDVLAAKKGRT